MSTKEVSGAGPASSADDRAAVTIRVRFGSDNSFEVKLLESDRVEALIGAVRTEYNIPESDVKYDWRKARFVFVSNIKKRVPEEVIKKLMAEEYDVDEPDNKTVEGLTLCLLDSGAPISFYLEKHPVSLRPLEKGSRIPHGVYVYAPLTAAAKEAMAQAERVKQAEDAAVADAEAAVQKARQAEADAEAAVQKAKQAEADAEAAVQKAKAQADAATLEDKDLRQAELGMRKAELDEANARRRAAVAAAREAAADRALVLAQLKRDEGAARTAQQNKFAAADERKKAQDDIKEAMIEVEMRKPEVMACTKVVASAEALRDARASGSVERIMAAQTKYTEALDELRGVTESLAESLKNLHIGPSPGTWTELIRDLFDFHSKNTRSVESSPSFATVGMREKKVLKDMDAIKPVPSGDGLAVLTDDEYAALQASELTESEVIKYFTPVLQPLVKEAAGKTGYNLILVNSERHPWVEDPYGGEASKPDMIVLDAALVATSVSNVDKPLAKDGFYFGVLADFDLCDSISVIMEWKVDMGKDAHAAFGEGLEYARRMHSPSRIGGTSCEEDRQRQHVMLADKKGFVLSVVKHNRAISYTHGQWNTPGSRNAIVDFFACRRKWLDAIRDSCRKLAVSPVVPAPVKLSLEKAADATNENKSAFLGRGATGRVFRVRGTSDDGPQLALKVSLGREGCSRLLSESFRCKTIAGMGSVEPMTIIPRLVGEYECAGLDHAALLFEPVGSRIGPPFTKYKIESALMALRELGTRGVHHGDARWPNVLWVGDDRSGRSVWTDMQTAAFTQDKSTWSEFFVMDVILFRSSFKLWEDGDDETAVRGAAAAFFKDAGALDGLSELFSKAWRR